MKRTNVTIVFLVIAIAIAWLFMRRSPNGSTLTEPPVLPTYKEIVIKKDISGTLYPEMEINAKSSVSGTLEIYYVQIGDKVRKGDRIAKIKVITNASQLEEAKAMVSNYRIQDEKLKRSYDRSRILYEKGLIAACEYDVAKAEYQENLTKYKAAQNQLQIMQGNGKLSNVVLAPCDGVVSILPLEPGASVMEISNYSEGTTVAQISQNSRFLFKSKVVEADVVGLRRGMKIPVKISSSEHIVTAELCKISTAGSYDEHGVMKYEIQAAFIPPEDINIFSGFSASASIILKRKKALTIPCDYVIFKGDSTFITIKENKNKVLHSVQIGDSDGEVYEVLKGIGQKTYIYKPQNIMDAIK